MTDECLELFAKTLMFTLLLPNFSRRKYKDHMVYYVTQIDLLKMILILKIAFIALAF